MYFIYYDRLYLRCKKYGGGDKAINISQLTKLYYQKQNDNTFEIVSSASPKIEFSINTIKLYSPKNPTSPGTTISDFNELSYNTLVLDDKYTKYVSKIISTITDETYVIICIQNNKNISDYVPDSSFNSPNNKTQILYRTIDQDLYTFSTLSLNGGAKSIYFSDLYNKINLLGLSKEINIPNADYNFNTIVFDSDISYDDYTINLKDGGFILINIRLNISNLPKLNIIGGTIIFNYDNSLCAFKNGLGQSTFNLNCTVIINDNIKIYHGNSPNLIIKDLINYGILLLHMDSTLGSEPNYSNITYIKNLNQIRIYNPCTINDSISNSGSIFIYSDVNIYDGRISNDEGGIINIETKGKLIFNYFLKKNYNFMIENIGGIVNIKENGTIKLNSENSNIKYFINNQHIVKIDGLLSNEYNSKKIYNDINSVIYLENDFNIEGNIEFDNNDVIISYIDKPIILTNK